MKVKCGRGEFDLRPKDIILDNDHCIQIISLAITKNGGFNTYPPEIAKTNWKKYLKTGSFEMYKEHMGNKYYRLK